MTVTAVTKDPEGLTMIVEAEFEAPPERIWQLWSDPRQLERWWGPPIYPATVTAHDLRPGGRVEYHMTGPSGDQPHGYWEVLEAEPPYRLTFRDGFADADGRPNTDMPLTEARVTIADIGGGRTRMSIQSRFPDTAAMEQLLAMGMEQGMTEAVGQIEGILANDGAPMSPTDPTITTHTIELPGLRLTYDVRRSERTPEPPLFLFGSPMAASFFGPLASHFPDRTIVTYDPRGSDRSVKADPSTPNSTEDQAEDLHRVIQAVGGPVDAFASSGGAVNGLALVARHPDDVRTLVAHEPPLAPILPDSEPAMAAIRGIGKAYQERGFGAGMAAFMALTAHRGPFTREIASQPAPDPAMFGLPTADDGARDDVLLEQNLIATTFYEPDFDALRAAATRIVVAAGEESADTLASRGAYAVAERLGSPVTLFPSHHGGFVAGEGSWGGKPAEFAARLREVLAGD
nr:alpha/beta fold hydrolase [Candidatus Limnocylindrales bacterium]